MFRPHVDLAQEYARKRSIPSKDQHVLSKYQFVRFRRTCYTTLYEKES